MEEWKFVVGYEGKYQVSNLGRVRSVDHYVEQISSYGSHQRRLMRGRVLKQNKTRTGYMIVYFSTGKKYQWHTVHRLVADAFIPNPYHLRDVNHTNGDKSNNRADNLEWCDNSYNVRYHNVVKNSYGRATDKKNSTSMTTSKALLLMNEDEIPVDVFASLADAGRRYEASQNSIRRSARSHKPTKKGEQFFFVDDFLKRLYVREGYIIELYEE